MKTPKLSRTALDDPLERVIEKKVCDYAKTTYGVKHYKFTSPQRRNVPDRLLFWPGGFMCLVEFKRRGRGTTPAQEREITSLIEMGHKVVVIDSIEFGREVIDAISKEFKVSTD